MIGGLTGKDSICAAKKPAVLLGVKVNESENEFSAEVISHPSPGIPSVPFCSVSDEYIQRLVVSVPTRQVELVIRRILYSIDLWEV
jgi:hypothetical protein